MVFIDMIKIKTIIINYIQSVIIYFNGTIELKAREIELKK